MIIAFLLTAIYLVLWLISSPLRLLNDVSLPTWITNQLTTIGNGIYTMDKIIPMSGFLTLIGFIGIIELSILTYKGIMWNIHRIPGE